MSIRKILIFTLFLVAFPLSSWGVLKVDIVGGNAEPLPIAIIPFEATTKSLRDEAKLLTEVFTKDLESTGLFHIIDPEAFPEKTAWGVMPMFVDWRALHAQALVQARVSLEGKDQIRLEFYMWDVDAGEQIEAQSLIASKKTIRRLAHIMGDAIYERLTGEGGYFDTQIAFIAESGSMKNRSKRLAIMDSDGYGMRYASPKGTYVLKPFFSPNMQKLVFLSYKGDDLQIWMLDMMTGAQRKLGNFKGMTFAPRFSADGQKIAFSQVIGGNTNLYEINLNNNTMRRLTKTNGIDTSPSYSPDGKHLIFSSDRSGSQQLYIMNLANLDVERLTYGSGSYATPAWSPRGDFIAFTKISDGNFSIGIMTPKGDSEQILASAWFVESPSWAPNGRRVVYTMTEPIDDGEDMLSRIMTVDITGQNEYQINSDVNGSDPSWSPRLP